MTLVPGSDRSEESGHYFCGIPEIPTMAATGIAGSQIRSGLSPWSSSDMGSAAPDVSDSVAVMRPETSVRRPEMSWWRLLVKLESGARQTLGNCAMASFPVFQSFFPEGIAERAVIIQLAGSLGAVRFFAGRLRLFSRFTKSEKVFNFSQQGRICRSGIGSFHGILSVDGNRAENKSQQNGNSQNSHSFILLDNSSDDDNAIYFEKTKCQEGKNNYWVKPGRVCHFGSYTRLPKAGKRNESKRF